MHINDLDISQRNYRKEWLERANTLMQGQMKAIMYLELALGRPHSLMLHGGLGD